jgi:YHS domain-containing protein
MLSLLLALAITTAPQNRPATNPICPVFGGTVNEQSQVVPVKGQDYRICCADCEALLKEKPDKYLKRDGTPKNLADNTICPVFGGKVNGKSQTVVVQGREYRICCAGCDDQLAKFPERYLEGDGIPKNAPDHARPSNDWYLPN